MYVCRGVCVCVCVCVRARAYMYTFGLIPAFWPRTLSSLNMEMSVCSSPAGRDPGSGNRRCPLFQRLYKKTCADMNLCICVCVRGWLPQKARPQVVITPYSTWSTLFFFWWWLLLVCFHFCRCHDHGGVQGSVAATLSVSLQHCCSCIDAATCAFEPALCGMYSK